MGRISKRVAKKGEVLVDSSSVDQSIPLQAASAEIAELRETLSRLSEAGQTGEIQAQGRPERTVPELRMVADVRSMTYRERMKHFGGIFIEYPRLTEILRTISRCHEISMLTGKPTSVFIEGRSNSGKSRLWEHYERSFQRIPEAERTLVPLLPILLPSPANPKSVATALLEKIGDRNAERGSTASQTSRLIRYIRECRVQLLVLDELHHFIDTKTEKVLHVVSEWLKSVIDRTGVPVVLLGLPRARAVLNYDEQLSRRFAVRRSLDPFPFDYAQPHTVDEFRKFLKVVDMQLPLAERSDLASHELAIRIHYATDGVIGYVMKLVGHAMEFALEENLERIGQNHLAKAFEEEIRNVLMKENPFTVDEFTPEMAAQWHRRDEERGQAPMEPETKKKTRRRQRAGDVLRT